MMYSMQVCPSLVVNARPERVWELLRVPPAYDAWIDGRVVRSTPDGPVAPGQEILVETRGMGRTWTVPMHVLDVDEEHRRLTLRVRLPLGLVNEERVTVASVDEGAPSWVRFD